MVEVLENPDKPFTLQDLSAKWAHNFTLDFCENAEEKNKKWIEILELKVDEAWRYPIDDSAVYF